MIECGTPALRWLTYASETEIRRVYHTCKVRTCPSCGYRAILQWQLEQETDLPNIMYSGLVFTMSRPFWHIFKENWHLLHDLPTLAGKAVVRWIKISMEYARLFSRCSTRSGDTSTSMRTCICWSLLVAFAKPRIDGYEYPS